MRAVCWLLFATHLAVPGCGQRDSIDCEVHLSILLDRSQAIMASVHSLIVNFVSSLSDTRSTTVIAIVTFRDQAEVLPFDENGNIDAQSMEELKGINYQDGPANLTGALRLVRTEKLGDPGYDTMGYQQVMVVITARYPDRETEFLKAELYRIETLHKVRVIVLNPKLLLPAELVAHEEELRLQQNVASRPFHLNYFYLEEAGTDTFLTLLFDNPYYNSCLGGTLFHVDTCTEDTAIMFLVDTGGALTQMMFYHVEEFIVKFTNKLDRQVSVGVVSITSPHDIIHPLEELGEDGHLQESLHLWEMCSDREESSPTSIEPAVSLANGLMESFRRKIIIVVTDEIIEDTSSLTQHEVTMVSVGCAQPPTGGVTPLAVKYYHRLPELIDQIYENYCYSASATG